MTSFFFSSQTLPDIQIRGNSWQGGNKHDTQWLIRLSWGCSSVLSPRYLLLFAALEVLKFVVCPDTTLNVQLSCKMILKNLAKQARLEITAIPTVLKALGRLSSAFRYAIYKTESASSQYAWDHGLMLLCGCPFGCSVSGRLKNKL